jgi:hypothetical protein
MTGWYPAREKRRTQGTFRGITVLLGLTLVGLSAQSLANSDTLPKHSKERLSGVVQILAKSASGRKLLEQAMQFWNLKDFKEVVRFLRWDSASRTDAVLIRHFDPRTGTEDRERKVTVFLRSNQKLEEVVMDLAHELSHAVAKPVWDPYDPDLSAGDYLYSSIEGPGGEIDAVARECQVATELSGFGDFDLSRCERYLKPVAQSVAQAEQKILRELIRVDFYKVGRWYTKLKESLGVQIKRFPLLSSQNPRLYSSTGQSPYPYALLREYEELTQIACENSRNRLRSFSDRQPASVGNRDPSRSVRLFLESRCGNTSVSGASSRGNGNTVGNALGKTLGDS